MYMGLILLLDDVAFAKYLEFLLYVLIRKTESVLIIKLQGWVL